MFNRKYANFDELRNLSVHIVVRVVNGNFSVLKFNTHFISAPYTQSLEIFFWYLESACPVKNNKLLMIRAALLHEFFMLRPLLLAHLFEFPE